jgi:hypothetical protein
MRHGLYALSYDGTTLIGRVVIQDATIFTTQLIDWLTGNVSPSGLVEGLVKGAAEYAVNEAITNVPSGCASANMMSLLAPYTSPIMAGTTIAKWQMLTGGGVYEEITVSEDLYFDVALGTPLRFPAIESTLFDLSLLEVKTIDVQFRTLDDLEPTINVPLGYVVQPYVGNSGLTILSPGVESYQDYTTEVIVSDYNHATPSLSSATLALQYSAPFFESPYPYWHFLLQTGKDYTMSYGYDGITGYNAFLSNWYNTSEIPADAVPFFSSYYPVNYTPYVRLFQVHNNKMFWRCGQSNPPIPAAQCPQLPVYVTHTDRLVFPSPFKHPATVPIISGLVILDFLKKGGRR